MAVSEVRHNLHTYVDELQVNNSSHIKGTTYLSSKRVNGHQGDGFRTWSHEQCHKTHNGWYLGLVVSQFAPLPSYY